MCVFVCLFVWWLITVSFFSCCFPQEVWGEAESFLLGQKWKFSASSFLFLPATDVKKTPGQSRSLLSLCLCCLIFDQNNLDCFQERGSSPKNEQSRCSLLCSQTLFNFYLTWTGARAQVKLLTRLTRKHWERSPARVHGHAHAQHTNTGQTRAGGEWLVCRNAELKTMRRQRRRAACTLTCTPLRSLPAFQTRKGNTCWC